MALLHRYGAKDHDPAVMELAALLSICQPGKEIPEVVDCRLAAAPLSSGILALPEPRLHRNIEKVYNAETPLLSLSCLTVHSVPEEASALLRGPERT